MSVKGPPTFNPMIPPYRDDPNSFYEWARQEQPICYSAALDAYMVSRYDDIKAILNDPETYSSTNAIRNMWMVNPPEVVKALEGLIPEAAAVVNTDEPAHTPLRGIVNHALSGRRVRAQLPEMTRRSNELVDRFLDGGTADLVHQYADPYVQHVVSLVFGIPIEDMERVQGWTEDVHLLMNPLAETSGKVAAARRLLDYQDYIDALAAERKANPREDFMSDLVHGTEQFPPVRREDLHSMFRQLRFAGYDTTVHLITSTLLLMLQDDRALWLRAQQDRSVVSRIIEETLRHDSPHCGLKRITTREVTIAETTLPPGTALLLLFGSANRDATRFPDPDEVRLDRPNLGDHVAFGSGIHQCPGQQLGRTEVRTAANTLLERLPDLRLTDDFRPVYKASYNHRGLEHLDVTW